MRIKLNVAEKKQKNIAKNKNKTKNIHFFVIKKGQKRKKKSPKVIVKESVERFLILVLITPLMDAFNNYKA